MANAYHAFSIFQKPLQCTNHLDFEDGEHNEVLCSATRRNLTKEQIGIITWSPVPSMNAEALAYFMPRLIELAVTGAMDREGIAIYTHFINWFFQGPNTDRYRLFGPEQNQIMADTFDYLSREFKNELEFEGWLEEARQGIENWRST